MSEILQFTGLISAFLVLCSVLKFYIYYKKFGISILRFIDIEEVLTLFFDNLIAYLSIIIPTTLYIYLLQSSVSISVVKGFGYYFNILYNKWFLVVIFFSIALIGVIYFKRKNKGVNNRDLILLITLVFCCSTIFPIAFMFFFDLTKESKQLDGLINETYLFFACLILLIYTILTAYNEYKKVFLGNYYSGTVIYLKDNNEIIKSDTTKMFIGMTKTFVFIYDKAGKKCIVYKMEDLLKIEFPNKRS